jgi:hypothetical protein
MLFWLDGNRRSPGVDLNLSLHHLSQMQEKGLRKRHIATMAHSIWHETLLQKSMHVAIYSTQLEFISHRYYSCRVLFVKFFL